MRHFSCLRYILHSILKKCFFIWLNQSRSDESWLINMHQHAYDLTCFLHLLIIFNLWRTALTTSESKQKVLPGRLVHAYSWVNWLKAIFSFITGGMAEWLYLIIENKNKLDPAMTNHYWTIHRDQIDVRSTKLFYNGFSIYTVVFLLHCLLLIFEFPYFNKTLYYYKQKLITSGGYSIGVKS